MASRDIVPDSSFSATSEFNDYLAAYNGRLNGDKSWAPQGNGDPNDYLQIDLGYKFIICAVATQGNPALESPAQEWTTKYKIQLSLDGTTFDTYKENNTDKVGIISILEKVR